MSRYMGAHPGHPPFAEDIVEALWRGPEPKALTKLRPVIVTCQLCSAVADDDLKIIHTDGCAWRMAREYYGDTDQWRIP